MPPGHMWVTALLIHRNKRDRGWCPVPSLPWDRLKVWGRWWVKIIYGLPQASCFLTQLLFPLSICSESVCVCRVICWPLNMSYRKMKLRNLPAAVLDKGEPHCSLLPAPPGRKGKTLTWRQTAPRNAGITPQWGFTTCKQQGRGFSPFSHHVAFKHRQCFPSQCYLLGDNVNRSMTKEQQWNHCILLPLSQHMGDARARDITNHICFGTQMENTSFFFFFFFQRLFFLFLWISYIKYEAIASLGGEGKGSLVLTHCWKVRGWSSACPETPRSPALLRFLAMPLPPLGSRWLCDNLRLHWEKKNN